MRRLGALVGAAERAERLRRRSCSAAWTPWPRRRPRCRRRPKVYFEEWDEPRISGIRWVAELVRIAGGDDIFPELAAQSLAEAPHPGRRPRDHRPRAGHRVRLVVRQEVPARQGGRARRLGRRAGRARRRAARDQVADHPAARPGGPDRRPGGAGAGTSTAGPTAEERARTAHGVAAQPSTSSPSVASISIMRPACTACSLDALPCSARLATPWAIAARRKKLKASTNGQSAGIGRPVSCE